MSALFIDANPDVHVTQEPSVARVRWVKINSGLLLDQQGEPRTLPLKAEIILNLFSDVTYTGVIEQVQQEGDGATWVGHLKGVDTSELFIVYTAGVFIGHFASPAGVYEVSSAGDDLYKVIQIDQQKLQGGQDDTITGTQNP